MRVVSFSNLRSLRCSAQVKLSGGGLWILNPIAATRELLDMVHSLEKQHGPVKHVVLGTVAIEHKTYAGVFAQKFPQCTVWLQPGQYDFCLLYTSPSPRDRG